MKRVFVLEDSDDRIEQLKENFNFVEFTFAKSVKEAVEKFDLSQEYDLIMLDHDLANNIEDGRTFCYWLVGQGIKVYQIIIHSHNTVAAEMMDEILANYNVIKKPFGQLMKLWHQGTLCFLGQYKYDG